MAKEKLLLLKNIRKASYKGDLISYRKAGGFTALEKVLSGMKPAEVVEAVKDYSFD